MTIKRYINGKEQNYGFAFTIIKNEQVQAAVTRCLWQEMPPADSLQKRS